LKLALYFSIFFVLGLDFGNGHLQGPAVDLETAIRETGIEKFPFLRYFTHSASLNNIFSKVLILSNNNDLFFIPSRFKWKIFK